MARTGSEQKQSLPLASIHYPRHCCVRVTVTRTVSFNFCSRWLSKIEGFDRIDFLPSKFQPGHYHEQFTCGVWYFQMEETIFRLRTVDCKPEEADVVIVNIDGIDRAIEVAHFICEGSQEHLVVFEYECIRFVASAQGDFVFHRVPDIPLNFARFCKMSYETSNSKTGIYTEYSILAAHYGMNVMKVPEAVLRMLAGVHNSVKLFHTRHSPNSANHHHSIELNISPDVPQEHIQDSHLVPGDKFLITADMTLPCDAILLTGKVVVDESMLTGESVPVSKVPIDLSIVEPSSSGDVVITTGNAADLYPNNEPDWSMTKSGSVLFGGTKVKATYGDQCVAVTYRTSFRSAKGQLVASLLKPKEGFVSFIADAVYVLALMFVLTTLLYIGTAVELADMGLDAGNVFLHYFDAITIAVPPALTACLTVSTTIAIARLKKNNIYVTDTSRVNFAGMISAVCFDKTGTLTENSLQFGGVRMAEESLENKDGKGILVIKDYNAESDPNTTLPLLCQLIMATCHSLSILGAGDIQGDPLEAELLRACRWSLSTHRNTIVATPPAGSRWSQCEVLKHFEFTPDKLRAASIVSCKEGSGSGAELYYVLKGSPEMVLSLCHPSSLPPDLSNHLDTLAKKGYRVIAIAHAVLGDGSGLDAATLTQEAIEGVGGVSGVGSGTCHLLFTGLLYLSNILKEDTVHTIRSLHACNIHVNMITGDHIYTAIAMGYMSKILGKRGKKKGVKGGERGSDLGAKGERGNKGGYRLIIIDEEPGGGGVTLFDYHSNTYITLSLPVLVASLCRADFIFSRARRNRASVPASASSPSSAAGVANPLVEGVVEDPADPETAGDGEGARAGGRIDSAASIRSSSLLALNGEQIELAMTGKGLRALLAHYSPTIVSLLVRYTKIFARMKPADKQRVVEMINSLKEFDLLGQSEGESASSANASTSSFLFSCSSSLSNSAMYWKDLWGGKSVYTGGHKAGDPPLSVTYPPLMSQMNKMEVMFCGDGGNDILALRGATVGVSLCDAETSIAAPITSKEQSPLSTVEVIRQGRSSLTIAYSLILFNIMYGVIQLFMAIILYSYGLKAGDYMYLIQDLFYTLVLGLCISYARPLPTLSTTLPPSRFLSPYFLTKLVSMLLLFPLFQISAILALQSQHFYDAYHTDDPLSSSYADEASVANNMALSQLMLASMVAPLPPPLGTWWYTNRYQIIALVGQMGWLLLQMYIQGDYFFKQILQIKPLPPTFSSILLALMVLQTVVILMVGWGVDLLLLERANRRWYEKIDLSYLDQVIDRFLQSGEEGSRAVGGGFDSPAGSPVRVSRASSDRKIEKKPLLQKPLLQSDNV
eukprot:gene30484-36845_t